MDGHKLSLRDTIYGALHRYQQPSGGQRGSSLGGLYGMPVTFKFRKVDGPAPLSRPERHSSGY